MLFLNNLEVLDKIYSCVIYFEGGVYMKNIIDVGLVVDINGGWLFFKEINGEIFENFLFF